MLCSLMPFLILDHTADVRLNVTGNTLEGLFQDSLLGMTSIMKPVNAENISLISREIIVIGSVDRTALLVDFLNEVLVWMTTEYEVYTDVEFFLFTEHDVKVHLNGHTVDAFEVDIKAVTYHEVNVAQDVTGKWNATIIFDI